MNIFTTNLSIANSFHMFIKSVMEDTYFFSINWVHCVIPYIKHVLLIIYKKSNPKLEEKSLLLRDVAFHLRPVLSKAYDW